MATVACVVNAHVTEPGFVRRIRGVEQIYKSIADRCFRGVLTTAQSFTRSMLLSAGHQLAAIQPAAFAQTP
jgi:hypothetical protein